MKKRAALLAIILAAATTAYATLQSGWIGQWSFTKSVEKYEGRFYRVVVDFKYKGEPQKFDFVVGCNVKITRYQDNSRTEDIGLIPAIYGRRMTDGKAVVVRPPDACYGQTTENKFVAEKFIPVITVYDNADTLDEGLAYITEDAYHSPRAELSLPVTRIHQSSREEFDKDGEVGITNLVTRDLYWSKQGAIVARQNGANATKSNRTDWCKFAQRYRLPEKIRKVAGQYWPPNKPKFWFPKKHEEVQAIHDLVYGVNENTPSLKDQYVEPQSGFAPYFRVGLREFRSADQGVPTVSDRYAIESTEISLMIPPPPPGIIAHYPIFSPVSQRHWPTSIDNFPAYIAGLNDPPFRDIQTKNNEFLGFASCWTLPDFTTEKEAAELSLDQLHELHMARSRKFYRVPGHTSVDGVRVFAPSGRLEDFSGPHRFLFERDEYAFELKEIDLGIIGGDVR